VGSICPKCLITIVMVFTNTDVYGLRFVHLLKFVYLSDSVLSRLSVKCIDIYHMSWGLSL